MLKIGRRAHVSESLGQSQQPLVIRFELLKEFLLSDEMRLSCITPSTGHILQVELLHIELLHIELLHREPPQAPCGLDIQGSVEARLGSLCCHVCSNMYVFGGFELVMTKPLKIRRNRTKNEDVYVEKSLFDLELAYGSTEAGRLSETPRLI